MKTRLLLLLLLTSCTAHLLFSQQQKSSKEGKLVLGSSFFFTSDSEEGASKKIIYQEIIWGLNVSMYTNNLDRVGISTFQVFEKNQTDAWENYYMVGASFLHDFFLSKKTKSPIVVEAGLLTGNFAPTIEGLEKRKNTLFLNTGITYDLYLSKKFSVEIGLNYCPTLSRIKMKDNFAFAMVQINYKLG